MDDPTTSLTAGSFGPDGELRTWGPFRIVKKLGQGSFGEVYRAWDPTLEREVALKLLQPSGDSDDYKSVLREARLIARVRHPNIVSVYGVDRHDDRVGFWSELIDGKTLSSLIDTQGPFSPTETALIGVELASALSAVHAAGLLHRDIKTSNAMRESGGRIRLLDFGLSHEHGTGIAFAGTPHYMAPELLSGGRPSVASDIYALGVVLYHLATGRYPPEHEASTSGSLLDLRPDLPPGFVKVVETATDRDPKKRYASAGAMMLALSGLIGGENTELKPRITRRVPRWLIGAGLAVALLGGAALTPPVSRFIESKRAGAGSPALYDSYLKAQELLVRYDKPGNTEKAVELFQETIAKDPQFPLAQAGLGRAYWRLYLNTSNVALIPKALAACDQAQKLDKQLAPVQVTMGMIHVGTGQVDLGMQELQQAERLNGNSPDVYAALSGGYQRQHRMADAKAAMQKAIDLAPTDWRWPYLLASVEIEAGEYAAAEGHVREAIQISPDNGLAYYNLGIVFLRQARYADAQTALEKAVQFAPTFRALSSLGSVLLWEGKYAEAATNISRAVQLNPLDDRAWGNLGSAYQRSPDAKDKARGAFLRAIEVAETARKNTPGDPRLIANLGAYYAQLPNAERSLPLLRQAITLAPDNPDVLFTVGVAYETLGRRKEALKSIAKSLDAGFSPETAKRTPGLVALRADQDAPASIK
ncbi:MAG TPA: protein kinase [Bryobacteraceae bacterium]|nr:protein kinase [Bryobacteraceae bacterium]